MHLPDQHTVLFEENQPQTSLEGTQANKLTAYFALVREGWRAEGKTTNDNGAPLYYADVPKWYRWQQKERTWQPRQRRAARDKAVIGRMYAVAPRDIDRFYLRMLLLNTPNVHDYVGPNGAARAR